MSRIVNITLDDAVHVGEVRSFPITIWADESENELEDISLWNTFEYTVKRYIWDEDDLLIITDIDKDNADSTLTINLTAANLTALGYGVFQHWMRRTDNPETTIFSGYITVKP